MMALPGFAKDKRGKQAMKIISYNIEYGMRADTTAGKTIFSTWMRNQDPDIVCLQEANKFTQKSLEASDNERIKLVLNIQFSFQ